VLAVYLAVAVPRGGKQSVLPSEPVTPPSTLKGVAVEFPSPGLAKAKLRTAQPIKSHTLSFKGPFTGIPPDARAPVGPVVHVLF
jgi:hypothetical protein